MHLEQPSKARGSLSLRSGHLWSISFVMLLIVAVIVPAESRMVQFSPDARQMATKPRGNPSGPFSKLNNVQPSQLSVPTAISDIVGGEQAESLLKRHPFLCAVMITTINAVAADLLAQKLTSNGLGTWWNPQRTVLFAVFGFAFQGCAQYAIVNLFWERLIPGSSIQSVIKKIAGMNCVSDTLLFFPCFYIFQQILQKLQDPNTIAWSSIVPKAIETYRSQYLSDWRNSWIIWFPGHAVTYGVLPPHQRIPWMACLSFVYMCILSWTRG